MIERHEYNCLTFISFLKLESTFLPMKQTSAIVDIGQMPASCANLREIGHIKSGFYSIMGKRNMETVHCNFAKQHHDPGTKIIFISRLPRPVPFIYWIVL